MSTVALLGVGKLGEALLSGFLRSGTPPGRMLAAERHAERAAEILKPRLHNSLIYPNMSIMGLNIHVRVIKPIAVDRTEVNIYPIRLVGAPAANADAIQSAMPSLMARPDRMTRGVSPSCSARALR